MPMPSASQKPQVTLDVASSEVASSEVDFLLEVRRELGSKLMRLRLRRNFLDPLVMAHSG